MESKYTSQNIKIFDLPFGIHNVCVLTLHSCVDFYLMLVLKYSIIDIFFYFQQKRQAQQDEMVKAEEQKRYAEEIKFKKEQKKKVKSV